MIGLIMSGVPGLPTIAIGAAGWRHVKGNDHGKVGR